MPSINLQTIRDGAGTVLGAIFDNLFLVASLINMVAYVVAPTDSVRETQAMIGWLGFYALWLIERILKQQRETRLIVYTVQPSSSATPEETGAAIAKEIKRELSGVASK